MTAPRVHTITIEGPIGRREIYAAASAAAQEGCPYWEIEQAMPDDDGASKRWIAAKGCIRTPLEPEGK